MRIKILRDHLETNFYVKQFVKKLSFVVNAGNSAIEFLEFPC